jgi:hypothetical protein
MWPEWYLIIIAIAAVSALGILWGPLLLALPLLALAVGASFIQAGLSVAQASSTMASLQDRVTRVKSHTLTAILHLLQPLARLHGRLRSGLTPWRRRGARNLAAPWPRTLTIWSEHWQASEERLRSVEEALRASGAIVRQGGVYDSWDLEVRGGMFGSARTCMALEDHDAGRQFVRFRVWPRLSSKGIVLTLLFAALFTGAALDQAWVAGAIFSVVFLLLALFTLEECAAATGSVFRALRIVEERATASAADAQVQQVTEPVEALPSRARSAAVGTTLDKPS